MKIKSLLLTAFAICISASSFAHALWIETNSKGKAGVAQQVKVFYGEYAENERDATSKWYSDVKDLTLWLIGPDQKKVKVNTTLGDNVATGTFTPESDGQYTLVVSHPAKDLAGTTKYQFLTSTTVLVGKSAVFNGDAISNELKIFPAAGLAHKANKPVKLKAVHNGAAKSEATVSVFSPAGWSQNLKTDADGNVTFIPLWPGKYVVEVTDFQKVTGQTYESLWLGSTYSFDVI